MKMFDAATDEESTNSPLGRGKGPSGTGVGFELGNGPTPALTRHPSRGNFQRS